MIRAWITDARTRIAARVSQYGELVIGRYAYDQSVYKELAVNDTAYNFYVPVGGQQFVITGIRLKADQQVSATVDAAVIVYEASAPDTTTVDKVLHQEALVRGESASLLPLNLLVSGGKFVNAKTSDDDIHMTIFGYYIQ